MLNDPPRADRACTGERGCPVEIHIHGCEVDSDWSQCNQWWEHPNRAWRPRPGRNVAAAAYCR